MVATFFWYVLFTGNASAAQVIEKAGGDFLVKDYTLQQGSYNLKAFDGSLGTLVSVDYSLYVLMDYVEFNIILPRESPYQSIPRFVGASFEFEGFFNIIDSALGLGGYFYGGCSIQDDFYYSCGGSEAIGSSLGSGNLAGNDPYFYQTSLNSNVFPDDYAKYYFSGGAKNTYLNGMHSTISGSWELGLTYTYTPAVPEPETYALMLLGLALVGAAAKRKSSRVQ